jgi:hypothetical protein
MVHQSNSILTEICIQTLMKLYNIQNISLFKMHEIFFVILPFCCKILYHTRRLTHIDVIHYFFCILRLVWSIEYWKHSSCNKNVRFPILNIFYDRAMQIFYDSMRHLRNMKTFHLLIASNWQKNEYCIVIRSWYMRRWHQ